MVGIDLAIPGSKGDFVEKYCDLIALYVDANQKLLVDNLKYQADYYLIAIEGERAALEEAQKNLSD